MENIFNVEMNIIYNWFKLSIKNRSMIFNYN